MTDRSRRRTLATVALLVLACIVALVFAIPAPAGAKSAGDTTRFFQDVEVAPGDVVHGDLTVIGGNAVIAGTVRGDVTVIGGRLETMPSARITGTVTELPNVTVSWVAPWLAPEPRAAPPESGISTVVPHEGHRFGLQIAVAIVAIFVFLVFPLRVRIALDRVERHPGLSAAVGVVAAVAVVPVAILLALSIVGIPLIVIEGMAVVAALCLGQAAVALLVGRRLHELVWPNATPSPLLALVLGLVVVSAAEVVPLVGWLVTALAWIVGFGAAILAFIGDAPFRTFAPLPTGGGGGRPRPPTSFGGGRRA